MKKLLSIFFPLLLTGCLGHPENIPPVNNFDKDKYLGKWYEIARLDHSFERGLSKVSAEYSMRDDGGIKVINKGYSKKKDKWSEAEGKAYFVGDKTVGHFKVSFFLFFYGSYVVFELDEDYQYAWITSSGTDYLWFLSRTPTVGEELKQQFIAEVKDLGFNTDEIIWVEQ